jgi:peptide/nickel transport system ATP-binding protein
VFDRCRIEEPELKPASGGHLAACHLHDARHPVNAAAMAQALSTKALAPA